MTSYTLQNRSQEKGFTLIELSIVLIIIGLIVSSVLVGQDLIRAAEGRGVSAEYNEFQIAVGAFRVDNENDLPGDANGNNLIGVTSAWASDGENTGFWQALSADEKLRGNYGGGALGTATIQETLPESKTGDFWGIYAVGTRNFFVHGVTNTATMGTIATLSPFIAEQVDAKIDDGLGNGGVVRAHAAGLPDAAVVATCAAPTTGVYDVANDEIKTCVLSFRLTQ